MARRNTPNRERVSLLGDRGGRGKERRAGGREFILLPVAVVEVYVLETLSFKVGVLSHSLVVQVVQLIRINLL